MEIHKPKPVHNWREFLSEVGVVVLGVCIAISLDQLVESWRWNHEVNRAREALHAEISANEANLFARRLALKSCMDRQMREAHAILADLEAGRKPGRFTTFHIGASGPTRTGEWEAQRAAQTLAHFPPEELALMGSYYGWVADFRDWTNHEEERWSELSVLRNPPAGLGPSDFMRLRASLAAVRRIMGLIELNSSRAVKAGDALGVPRPPEDQDRARLFCSVDEEDFVQGMKPGAEALR